MTKHTSFQCLAKSLPGPLDKVDQSDYRKTTIHFEKISCQSQLPRNQINNMDQNQPITTDGCDLWNPLKIAYVSQEVNLRVKDGGEKM